MSTPMVKYTSGMGGVSYIRFEDNKVRLTGADGTPEALSNCIKDEVMFAETVKATKPADSAALLAITKRFVRYANAKLEAISFPESVEEKSYRDILVAAVLDAEWYLADYPVAVRKDPRGERRKAIFAAADLVRAVERKEKQA